MLVLRPKRSKTVSDLVQGMLVAKRVGSIDRKYSSNTSISSQYSGVLSGTVALHIVPAGIFCTAGIDIAHANYSRVCALHVCMHNHKTEPQPSYVHGIAAPKRAMEQHVPEIGHTNSPDNFLLQSLA